MFEERARRYHALPPCYNEVSEGTAFEADWRRQKWRADLPAAVTMQATPRGLDALNLMAEMPACSEVWRLYQAALASPPPRRLARRRSSGQDAPPRSPAVADVGKSGRSEARPSSAVEVRRRPARPALAEAAVRSQGRERSGPRAARGPARLHAVSAGINTNIDLLAWQSAGDADWASASRCFASSRTRHWRR